MKETEENAVEFDVRIRGEADDQAIKAKDPRRAAVVAIALVDYAGSMKSMKGGPMPEWEIVAQARDYESCLRGDGRASVSGLTAHLETMRERVDEAVVKDHAEVLS